MCRHNRKSYAAFENEILFLFHVTLVLSKTIIEAGQTVYPPIMIVPVQFRNTFKTMIHFDSVNT